MANFFEKRDSAVLDYVFDWAGKTNSNPSGTSDWLESGEKISGFTVTAGSGITIEDSYLTNNSTSVTVWLSGGQKFQEYDVVCSIETNSAPITRKDKRTIKLKVI